jgi:alpha-beta hydrolase superfamily lysophospholipase
MSVKTLARSGALLLALAVPASAAAADNPYEKGPAPTAANLQAAAGSYAATSVFIPDSATPGFGSARVWMPTGAPGETFGAIAVSPGFTESETAIRWIGQRLVSRGFVVVTFNNNDIFELPAARASELLAALDYVVSAKSPAQAIVDPTRLAVAGHSMGGGGTLEAAVRRPSLKAAIALAPWRQASDFSRLTVPTLVVAAQNDFIAPRLQHATPMYKSIPKTTPKMYIEMAGADHFITNKPTRPVQATAISWAKRFIDNDTRYSSMLCPIPQGFDLGLISGLAHNCPF